MIEISTRPEELSSTARTGYPAPGRTRSPRRPAVMLGSVIAAVSIVALSAPVQIAMAAPGAPSSVSRSGSNSVSDSDIESAEALLRSTRADRERAEARLAEATGQQVALRNELENLQDGAARITQDLAEARAAVREYAVAAYIDGGQSAIIGVGLDPSEHAELAWHTELTASRTSDSADAVDRYEALKASNDPDRVAAAARLDEVNRLVETASTDAIQAAAHERDAEVALQRLRDDRAAARARAAEDARAAAATASVTARSAAVPAEPAAAPEVARSEPQPQQPATAQSTGSPTAAEAALLARIRHCESRGNYQIVSASGRYRGAYQFDYRTWAGVGGSGDPAAASPAEQDYRALLLLRSRGSRPWPNCG